MSANRLQDANEGDTVEATYTYPSGDTVVKTFVVTHKAKTFVEGKDLLVYFDQDSSLATVTAKVTPAPVPAEPTAPGALVEIRRKILTQEEQTLVLMRSPGSWSVVKNSTAAHGLGSIWGWDDIVNAALPGSLRIVDPGYTDL